MHTFNKQNNTNPLPLLTILFTHPSNAHVRSIDPCLIHVPPFLATLVHCSPLSGSTWEHCFLASRRAPWRVQTPPCLARLVQTSLVRGLIYVHNCFRAPCLRHTPPCVELSCEMIEETCHVSNIIK